MSYHATECIMDLLAASGPQSYTSIRREVETQATCGDTTTINTNSAVLTLIYSGLVIAEDDADDGTIYDLTSWGYAVMSVYATEAERNRERHLRQQDMEMAINIVATEGASSLPPYIR